jgi:peptidoglycan/xylan/chitin deacetylase (PgdA/CDA1 family)
MPRSTLPQNYLLNQGTVLEDFENINNLTIAGGLGEENFDQYRTGTKSLKLTATADGGAPNAVKTINLNLASCQLFSFWVYLHSAEDTDWQITLDFGSVADLSKRMRATFEGNKWLYQNQWRKLSGHRDDFISYGGESWSNQMIRARVTAYSHGGKRISASFDDLRYGEEGLPRCVITFDDGYSDDIGGGETEYDYMIARGLRGTLYVIPSAVDTPGRVSLSQLESLYDNGWAIANHSNDHSNWVNGIITTQAQYEAAIQGGIDYLVNNGMPRAAYHLAYPGGIVNTNVLAAMSSRGMITGRTTNGYYQPAPMANYYFLQGRLPATTTTLNTAKSWIDLAIKQQSTVILGFHDILDSGGTSNKWSIANFKGLIDYIVARKIKCVTIDEWYEGLTNPRFESIPLGRVAV